jgi:hypothetical protein
LDSRGSPCVDRRARVRPQGHPLPDRQDWRRSAARRCRLVSQIRPQVPRRHIACTNCRFDIPAASAASRWIGRVSTPSSLCWLFSWNSNRTHPTIFPPDSAGADANGVFLQRLIVGLPGVAGQCPPSPSPVHVRARTPLRTKVRSRPEVGVLS